MSRMTAQMNCPSADVTVVKYPVNEIDSRVRALVDSCIPSQNTETGRWVAKVDTLPRVVGQGKTKDQALTEFEVNLRYYFERKSGKVAG